MCGDSPKDRDKKLKRGKSGLTAFTAVIEPSAIKETRNELKAQCIVCPGRHRPRNCDKFKKLSYEEKRELVQCHKLFNLSV